MPPAGWICSPFQIQEIDAAQLRSDEEDILRQDRTRLANAESLAKHAQQALLLLEEGSPEVGGINDLLGEVSAALHSLARIDASQIPFMTAWNPADHLARPGPGIAQLC
jgi:DNA repair ATPase RecN